MSRLTLITLIICGLCILGMGLGNVSWGQCQQKVELDGFGMSGTYTACDKYMKCTFSYDYGDIGGDQANTVVFAVDNSGFSRSYWCGDYDGSDSPIIENAQCTSKEGHRIVATKYNPYSWLNGFYNCHFKVEYFATQQQ